MQSNKGPRGCGMAVGRCDVNFLAFGGLCPPTELVCPACPAATPVKCPGGGCVSDVRRCKANVWLHGTCDAGICDGVQQCHARLNAPYACWEEWPSDANASMTFADLGMATCSSCQEVWSSYTCSRCCSERATIEYNSTHAIPTRLDGGSVFMSGSRWVCMLTEVAGELGLANSVAGLLGRAAEEDSVLAVADGASAEAIDATATSPFEEALAARAPEYDAADFPMPDFVI